MKKICKEQYEKDFKEMFKFDKNGLMTDIDCYVSNLENKINNLQSKIDKAVEYIEKNTHNIYANGYRDRETGELLSKEKTPIINRVFSQNPKDLLDILKEVE